MPRSEEIGLSKRSAASSSSFLAIQSWYLRLTRASQKPIQKNDLEKTNISWKKLSKPYQKHFKTHENPFKKPTKSYQKLFHNSLVWNKKNKSPTTGGTRRPRAPSPPSLGMRRPPPRRRGPDPYGKVWWILGVLQGLYMFKIALYVLFLFFIEIMRWYSLLKYLVYLIVLAFLLNLSRVYDLLFNSRLLVKLASSCSKVE